MTLICGNCDKLLMSDSVTPSERYSIAWSCATFSKGMTAIESMVVTIDERWKKNQEPMPMARSKTDNTRATPRLCCLIPLKIYSALETGSVCGLVEGTNSALVLAREGETRTAGSA